jgi:hypothetical protein
MPGNNLKGLARQQKRTVQRLNKATSEAFFLYRGMAFVFALMTEGVA